jgi:hypothetical protein
VLTLSKQHTIHIDSLFAATSRSSNYAKYGRRCVPPTRQTSKCNLLAGTEHARCNWCRFRKCTKAGRSTAVAGRTQLIQHRYSTQAYLGRKIVPLLPVIKFMQMENFRELTPGRNLHVGNLKQEVVLPRRLSSQIRITE